MKAEAFVKLLRTIINEEVRKVVREELRNSINETTTRPNNSYYEPKTSLRDKYSSILNMDDMHSNTNQRLPLNKEGKPAIVNLSGNSVVNSILMETANQMKQDPGSNAFFEGLR